MPTIEELKAKYKPTETEYTFTIEGGESFTAKRVSNASDKVRLMKRIDEHQKVVKSSPAPQWKPFLPAEPEVIKLCVAMEALLIEPPMTFLDALEIAATCEDLIFDIGRPLLDAAEREATANEVEKIEAEKND